MTALISLLIGVIAFVVLAGISGPLGDEGSARVRQATRTMARVGARGLPAAEDEKGRDWIADVEGEIADAECLPLTLLLKTVTFAAGAWARRGWRCVSRRPASELGHLRTVARLRALARSVTRLETAAARKRALVVALRMRSYHNAEVRLVATRAEDDARSYGRAATTSRAFEQAVRGSYVGRKARLAIDRQRL